MEEKNPGQFVLLGRMREGYRREFTDDIACGIVFARNELSTLHSIDKSDRRMKISNTAPTPYEESKMEPAGQVTTAHPTWVVLFQTTWVKWEGTGLLES